MATLVLQVAGAAIGGLVGGPAGAIAGRALGGLAGYALDSALFGGGAGGGTRRVEGPRLRDMDGLASQAGAAIPRLYGRARLGGQLIWATRFEEIVTTQVSRAGAQGGKGAPRGPRTITMNYSYFANIAVGLCEGSVAFVRRVWADGRELDLTGVTMRLHRGTPDQSPDPLIVAKEGAGQAPAYRGLAYVVFERLPLADFGNRVPQFTFEVIRPVGGLGERIKAVCLIPGASEFGYDPQAVARIPAPGVTRYENRNQLTHGSDVLASLDALEALCPGLERVSLIVTWFGTDLRAGQCRIEPRMDDAAKVTQPHEWRVAGLDRSQAVEVSRVAGNPAYGGTPSDASVRRLIGELKGRGWEVVLYPFVMMDVPAGNGLADPWTGASSQPAYPWRGRITCDPAPGRPGSPDGTAAAALQVDALFGTLPASALSLAGEEVVCAQPDIWTLRRLVLHYAQLAIAAGGVQGFVIGTEYAALTRVRSGPGAYPAVSRLVALAQDLKALLGPATKITYAADWTEYGAHVRAGGSEVRFPLDPLWASPAIDAVGIDFYPPLTDWRDDEIHADLALADTIYDRDYLASRLDAGEAFDWFYASAADRRAQVRSPITDGAFGKPWVFRPKDVASWWLNPHLERVGGVEQAQPTAWLPASKPVWLTEFGIPAVDKGPNGPNVFPDPKSSENAAPPLSAGARDDLVQARAIEAVLERLEAGSPGHDPAVNPSSPSTGARMIPPGHIFLWAWDARPFPAFPDLTGVWSDATNWRLGHWLNGRIEGLGLDRLVEAVLADNGLPAPVQRNVDAWIEGYVVDRPMSVRDMLEPVLRLYGVDARASGENLRLSGRNGRAALELSPSELVPEEDGTLVRRERRQESELPRELRLGFSDGEGDYRRLASLSRRLEGATNRQAALDTALVLRAGEAQRIADMALQDLWAARDSAAFALPPQRLELEVGDVVRLPGEPGRSLYRVARIVDGETRRLEARRVEPAIYRQTASDLSRLPPVPPALAGRAHVVELPLPLTRGDPPALTALAAFADPWPGALVVWAGRDGGGFTPLSILDRPATLGLTLTVLQPGPLWRWDDAATVEVELRGNAPASSTDLQALEGAASFAVRGTDGLWEVFTAATVTLTGPGRYRLSRLLRGLGGSEQAAGRAVAAGATIVLLDEAVMPLPLSLDDAGRPVSLRVAPADRDHADLTAVSLDIVPGLEALLPLPPVHVRARREAAGVRVSWLRRARRNGDAWEPQEIPLGESAERYRLDILSGALVLRTIESGEPQALYAAADEIADFAAPQTNLTLRIAQSSPEAGNGRPRLVTVPILLNTSTETPCLAPFRRPVTSPFR